MGIWHRIFGSPVAEVKEFTLADPALLSLFGGTATAAGVAIGESQVMQDPTAGAAVRLLCGIVQTTPLHLYCRGEGSDRSRADDHPAGILVAKRANGWTSAGALRAQLMYDALHNGRAYALAIKVRGAPRELAYLPHGAVTRRVDEATSEPSYEVRLKAGGSRAYSYRDVIEIAPWLGRAPARDARESIARAAAMHGHASKLFRNGAKPSGVLKLPGRLNEIAAKRLSEAWHSSFGGENAGKVAVLEEGGSFESITLNSVDAEYSATLKATAEDIARHFGVPLTLLNHLDRAVWRNPEQLAVQFLQYTVAPIFEAFEAAFERVLLSDAERDQLYAEFLVDNIVKADIAARYTAYSQAISSRFMTPNEIRAREGLPRHADPIADQLQNPNTSPGAAAPADPAPDEANDDA